MSQLRPSVAAKFAAFVLERYPFAAAAAASAFEVLADSCGDPVTPHALERSGAGLPEALRRALASPPPNLPETTPAVCVSVRWTAAVDELVEACDGFLRRAAIAASLTADERLEILRGMALTRATDNRLKAFFTGGEVRYGDAAFQGKGFRSLGQEAIYAAGIRLRRGTAYRADGGWRGDVVAPLIRDLGVVLAMKPDSAPGAAAGDTPEACAVRMALSAQMAKGGPPMNGKDLHLADFASGILPPAAPLGISTMAIAGM